MKAKPKKEKSLKQSSEQDKNILNLSRQANLVPFNKVNEWTVKVFGVGSIGSHTVKTLAKSGFRNLEVYDCDTVEQENIAAQAFDFKHIKMPKVEAMKQIVLEGSGVEIKTFHGTVTKETDLVPEPNTIYACFFDSFEGRKLVFNKVKDFPTVFVDGRIGKYDMRQYLTDLTNEDFKKEYARTLEVTAVSDLACGDKASAPINVQIAGKIVMNIINFITGKDYSRISIVNAMRPNNGVEVLVIREKPPEKEVSSDAIVVEQEAETSGTEGQDRKNYSDEQDRETYTSEVEANGSRERIPEPSGQEIQEEV